MSEESYQKRVQAAFEDFVEKGGLMSESKQERLKSAWISLDAAMATLTHAIEQANSAIKARSRSKIEHTDFRPTVNRIQDLIMEIRLIDEMDKEDE